MLRNKPLRYENLEDAKLAIQGLNLIFQGRLKIQSFIILKEVN